MIALGITTMIIAIITNSRVGSYDEAIIDFRDNWMLKPIIDIKTALSEWPAGYEDLIRSSWPGTKVGCDCTYSFSHYLSGLRSGTCDSNQTEAGCRTVPSTKPVPINKFYSYRICGRRSGDNFVDAVRPAKRFGGSDGEWKYGYKAWGSGPADYRVCVREQEECPLNHIYITSLSDPSQAPAGYKAQQLDNGQYVVFTSNSDKLPTVRFKLTEGDIWVNPAEVVHSPGRKEYTLLNSYTYSGWSTKIGGVYKDPRYTSIGSVREDRLFNDNGVIYVIRNLPKYPVDDSMNYFWNLYSADYYYWSASCDDYGTYSRPSMIGVMGESEHISSLTTWLVVICVFQVVICWFIIEGVILCYTYQNLQGSHEGCVKPHDRFKFEMITGCVKIAFLLLKALLFYLCVSSTNSYSGQMQNLSSENCFDSHSQSIFTEYSSSLIAATGLTYWGLIITLGSTALTVGMMVYTAKSK